MCCLITRYMWMPFFNVFPLRRLIIFCHLLQGSSIVTGTFGRLPSEGLIRLQSFNTGIPRSRTIYLLFLVIWALFTVLAITSSAAAPIYYVWLSWKTGSSDPNLFTASLFGITVHGCLILMHLRRLLRHAIRSFWIPAWLLRRRFCAALLQPSQIAPKLTRNSLGRSEDSSSGTLELGAD